MVSRLSSLSVRPPTPPTDLQDLQDLDNEINDALQLLDDPFGTKAALTAALKKDKPLVSTPQQSPPSETALSSSPPSTRKKRVNFELHQPSNGHTAAPWTPRHSSPLRPLPRTRFEKPLKSILKPSDPTSTPPPQTDGATAHKFETFADMLESVVKMLAQGARPSKLDAYISLQRTMQAYDKVPDIHALTNKMGLFAQFIMRDMQAVGISGSGPDSQLVTQALKFLMVLVRIPELRPAMDDDFCSSVIDQSTTVAADPFMPKAVINTHLALLMQQNFRPKVMTAARVESILAVLDDIHERVSGYSVQAYRIRVYRKLIHQSPEVMARHTERWFKHMLKAMLSGQKDINQSALDAAVGAAKVFGSQPQVTKSVLATMNRVKTDGDTFGKLFAHQLDKALSTDSAALVPQVWGAVTAFLRGSLQGSAFSAAKDWLEVLMKFFTPEVDDGARLHANVAFTFLVYAMDLTGSTSQLSSNMLQQLSKTQLTQQQPARRAQINKGELNTVTSSYLTLLYYALRPSAPHAQLTRYWREFVVDFWTPLVHLPTQAKYSYSLAACRVASALFRGSRKPWNENRALELKPQLMVQRHELPLLDPKWVRKSLASVLQFVETLLEATPWTADLVEDQPVKALWIALIDSLVEAGSKEVMATSEAKDAFAHIVNMLGRMWEVHTAQLALPQQSEDNWADKYCFLIETVVQKLGALQFADKCLCQNVQKEFEVAPTPSSRSRQHGPRVSSLLHLVDLLVCRSEGRLADGVRLRVLELVLDPCLEVQNTRLAMLELLRDCAHAVTKASSPNQVASSFWNRIADLAKSCIEQQPSDPNERSFQQLGKEYDLVVDILAFGSIYLPSAPCAQELLTSFADTVRREAGDGAVVIAVMEKVSSRILMRQHSEGGDYWLDGATILLKNFRSTITRRTLDLGRQNLYSASPAPNRLLYFKTSVTYAFALIPMHATKTHTYSKTHQSTLIPYPVHSNPVPFMHPFKNPCILTILVP